MLGLNVVRVLDFPEIFFLRICFLPLLSDPLELRVDAFSRGYEYNRFSCL